MRPGWGSDRPSVGLTPEERQQFAEIAARLRYELDGLSFDLPDRWWHRFGTALSRLGGRTARRVVSAASTWWVGPVLVALGGAALAGVAVADAAGGPGHTSGAAGAWVVAGWAAGVVFLLVGILLSTRAVGRRAAVRGRWRWPSAVSGRSRSMSTGERRSARH